MANWTILSGLEIIFQRINTKARAHGKNSFESHGQHFYKLFEELVHLLLFVLHSLRSSRTFMKYNLDTRPDKCFLFLSTKSIQWGSIWYSNDTSLNIIFYTFYSYLSSIVDVKDSYSYRKRKTWSTILYLQDGRPISIFIYL
jgi:hypothetical protein